MILRGFVRDGLVKIKTFAGKCLEVSARDPSVETIVQGDCDDRYTFQEFQIHDLGVLITSVVDTAGVLNMAKTSGVVGAV
ncbi:hypothetical protein ACIQRE_00130 [Streptomyces griseoluteus]|uniref:hypothetical protein n=1 Tax=Streptomyces griseoluteus TaxID=29306 RepID=UPI003827900B